MSPSISKGAESIIPKGEPFANLAALQRQNAALMRTLRSEYKLKPEDVLKFLGRLKSTGGVLASDEERDAAQDALRYWCSIAVSLFPQAAREFSRLELDDFHGGKSSESSPASAAEALPNSPDLRRAANEMTARLDRSVKATLRQLLTQLITLEPGAQKVSFRPLPVEDEVVRRPLFANLIKTLADKRILRQEGTTPSFWTLTDNALLEGWELLKRLCDERMALRDLASGWESLGRARSALLNRGDQLNRAGQFIDLNALEKEFVSQSQRQRDQFMRYALAILGVVAIVLGGIVFYVDQQRRLADQKTRELLTTQSNLEATIEQLKLTIQSRQSILTNFSLAISEASNNLADRKEDRVIARIQPMWSKLPTYLLDNDFAGANASIKGSEARIVALATTLSNETRKPISLDFQQYATQVNK